ncbi:hypothetical protein Tco_0167395, partial [Tanacetum coccineum]
IKQNITSHVQMNAPGKSVDSFEEGEIIGESDDGCVKDCMGKKLGNG